MNTSKQWDTAFYGTTEDKQRIGEHQNTSEPILKLLATDKQEAVRLSVARNTQCPHNILHYLSSDEEITVRREVMRNPRTQEHTLTVGRTDPAPCVRDAADRGTWTH